MTGRGDVGVFSLRLTRLRVVVLVACLSAFAVTFAQPAAADSGSGSTTTAASDPSTSSSSGTADPTATDSSSTAAGSAATTTDPTAPAATDATALRSGGDDPGPVRDRSRDDDGSVCRLGSGHDRSHRVDAGCERPGHDRPGNACPAGRHRPDRDVLRHRRRPRRPPPRPRRRRPRRRRASP